MNPCHLAILCFHTLSHFFALAESSILLLSTDSALFGKKHGGVGEGCILWGGRSTASPVTRHESRFTIRCIIPPREHPPQRSRMSRHRLPHRKRNHHSRILSALLKRPRQRLQPEIESRSGHESRRIRRPPGPPFSRCAIFGPFRQRFGQPRHEVRTPPPGSFQHLSPRNRHPLRFVAARPANS